MNRPFTSWEIRQAAGRNRWSCPVYLWLGPDEDLMEGLKNREDSMEEGLDNDEDLMEGLENGADQPLFV